MDENEKNLTFEDALANSQALFEAGTEDAETDTEAAGETVTEDTASVEEQTENTTDVVAEEGGSDNATGDAEEVAGNASTSPSQLEQALFAAEQAANAAQQMQGRVSSLEEQNRQLTETIQEMNRAREQEVTEEFTLPPLDFSAMMYEDAQTVAEKQRQYSEAVAKVAEERARKSVMAEVEPFLQQARAEKAESEFNNTVEELSALEQFADIRDLVPQMKKIIAANTWLNGGNVPVVDKIANAYAMAKGVNAINTPQKAEMTADEFLEAFKQRRDIREAIERERVSQIKADKGQQVPVSSASSGAGNAALTIKEKPQTMSEASARARELFFGKS